VKDNEYISKIDVKDSTELVSYAKSIRLDILTPQGLGTLLSIHDGLFYSSNISICTWFLIEKDLAMSISHCIPEKVKIQKDINCGEFLQGSFKTKSG